MLDDRWVGNCRQCGAIPGHSHSPFCSYAEKPKKCDDCGGTGETTHQDGGPCATCKGKGKVGGALAKYEAEITEMLRMNPLPPETIAALEKLKRKEDRKP